jgi:hypothetical protein
MSKYLVTFCYTRYEAVEIEANYSDEACEQAYIQALCPATSDWCEIVECIEIPE